MANDEKEIQLIKLLFDEWQKASYAKRLHGRSIYFAILEQCYLLSSIDAKTVDVNTVDALATSQEESDTRIILHCNHSCKTTPDTFHIIV